jgi:pentose-5-phosphate-3-epimerase
VDLEVDGGIRESNAAGIAAAGASVLVVGSAVFNQKLSVAANIAALRQQLAAVAV